MDKKLKAMFEFQRFEKNSRLQKLIEETENRMARELLDDDLWMVNAAGIPEGMFPESEKKQEGRK